MIQKRNLHTQVKKNTFDKVFRDTGAYNCIASRQIDPYGKGCYFNCKYCFSKGMLYDTGYWHPNNPAISDIKNIAKAIKKHFPTGSVVRIGGLTDAFQPIENVHRLTYKTLLLLNRKKVHYLIVSKSTLVATQRYLDIYDDELAHFQISLTTTDDDFRKKISPRVPSFKETKETIETLYNQGYDTIIRASPIFYDHMDWDELNSIECDKILVEPLYVNANIRRFCGKYLDNLEDYTFHQGNGSGYNLSTLPIEKQLWIRDQLTGFKEVNFCNGFPELNEYFREHVNCNEEFCCNLRGVSKKNGVRLQLLNKKY